jgi:catechol 2,3-dioxygenase-like lactoylglutathione lyase family enzyme
MDVAQPPQWVTTRIARPTADLPRATAFYRDLLGLTVTGGFEGHDGYDGVFFALPGGGGELELTAGPVTPRPGTDEDLLVLYLATQEEVADFAAHLDAAGVPSVASRNPYWRHWAREFLDPDGYRVLVAAVHS